ncbi:MAG: indole-3-glycerol phosphate synthase TrpC [Planctomycetota bacterium]
MTTILERIVATKEREIATARMARPESQLESALANIGPTRDFFGALAARGPIKLIAEVKKASPSKGIIRPDFCPVDIATAYEKAGASCLSVLTDVEYFQGSLDYLAKIRAAVDVPLLRKDFILDRYQLLEARLAGADAVLLIAEILDDCRLRSLHQASIDLGLTPLVEIYEPANLPRVLDIGATLIGVNNRNLHTFEVDLNHCIRLRNQIPLDCVMVGESGIHGPDDVQRLANAGIDAILVGEHLMRQPDIGLAVRHLLHGNEASPNG